MQQVVGGGVGAGADCAASNTRGPNQEAGADCAAGDVEAGIPPGGSQGGQVVLLPGLQRQESSRGGSTRGKMPVNVQRLYKSSAWCVCVCVGGGGTVPVMQG
jgi:hypothetical protein